MDAFKPKLVDIAKSSMRFLEGTADHQSVFTKKAAIAVAALSTSASRRRRLLMALPTNPAVFANANATLEIVINAVEVLDQSPHAATVPAGSRCGRQWRLSQHGRTGPRTSVNMGRGQCKSLISP